MTGKLKKEANLSAEKGAMLYFHLANCRGALGARARGHASPSDFAHGTWRMR